MKLLKNSIFPLAALLLLTYLGQYIYIVDGQIDWLRFCLWDSFWYSLYAVGYSHWRKSGKQCDNLGAEYDPGSGLRMPDCSLCGD